MKARIQPEQRNFSLVSGGYDNLLKMACLAKIYLWQIQQEQGLVR